MESNGRVNSSLAKPGFVLQPEQPVEGQERGVGNYALCHLLLAMDAIATGAKPRSINLIIMSVA